jgi:hypothetical protein
VGQQRVLQAAGEGEFGVVEPGAFEGLGDQAAQRGEDATYRRDGSGGRRQLDRGGSPFGRPAAFYRSEFQPAAAIRVLRADQKVTELAFVRPDITAWFTLDLDPHTLVLRAMHMRAEGHVMDDMVTGVNRPVTVRPPGGGVGRGPAGAG